MYQHSGLCQCLHTHTVVCVRQMVIHKTKGAVIPPPSTHMYTQTHTHIYTQTHTHTHTHTHTTDEKHTVQVVIHSLPVHVFPLASLPPADIFQGHFHQTSFLNHSYHTQATPTIPRPLPPVPRSQSTPTSALFPGHFHSSFCITSSI